MDATVAERGQITLPKAVRDALGLTASPVPAPWSVIRWLPAGPTLSYAAAMSQHDTLIPDTPAKVLDKQGG